jgi:ubiquinone/menaquinone biosynthesis C-methylase UbiE
MAFHRDEKGMRSFYDGFHPWYGFVEGNTGTSIARALELIDPGRDRFAGESILEHCCGSGSLGLALAGRCGSYEGRDQSEGMLGRAASRWRSALGPGSPPPFHRESVLAFADPPASFDRIAIAFALHLFSPEEEFSILRTFWRSSRRGILVIDHGRGFAPLLSLIEALEGSWYQAYRRLDFSLLARELGARFEDREVEGTRVMEFLR